MSGNETFPDNDDPERARRVAGVLRSAARTERAPEALQTRISTMQAQMSTPRHHRLRSRRGLNLLRLGVPATAAGLAAIVVVFGGGAGAPSLAQAAALSTRPPTAPAPSVDPGDPGKLLTARVGTLHFPDWQAAGGWRAVGQRHDQIGDRSSTTVYYAHGSNRVAYSILSSPVLSVRPGKATLRWTTVHGQYTATLWKNGRATVVWQESGHTCLLTGPRGMAPASLWRLAFYGFRRPLTR